MDTAVAFLGIGGALLLGAMSPGPSFLVVLRAALTSRRFGVAAALGTGLGGALLAVLALVGLQAALLTIPALFLAFKIVGAAYLLVLAWRLWQGAGRPLSPDRGTPGTTTPPRAFAGALVTQLSNPKTLLVYGSVFAAGLPAEASGWFSAGLVLFVIGIEVGWYLTVALILGSAAPRAAYLRVSLWVDRAAAFAMGGLAIRLVLQRSTT